MTYALLFLFCVAFFELFIVLGLPGQVVTLLAGSRRAIRIPLSAELDDEEKEALMRRESLAMLKATSGFMLRFGALAAVLYLLYRASILVYPDLEEPMLEALVSPIVIVSLTVSTMAYAWVRRVFVSKL